MEYMIKEVVGYEGLYAVDNEGNVFSIKKDGLKLLKPLKTEKGYLIVKLSKFGKGKHKKIHRLVLEAFLPNKDADNLTVNHKDEDKTNNNIDNLEWMTIKQNIVYSHAHPVVQLDKNDNLIAVYESINEAARQVNGKAFHISECIQGKRKTHKESKWILYEDYFKLTITNKGDNLTN